MPRGKALTEEKQAEIIRDFRESKDGYRKVAARHGVSHTTVKKLAKSADLTPAPANIEQTAAACEANEVRYIMNRGARLEKLSKALEHVLNMLSSITKACDATPLSIAAGTLIDKMRLEEGQTGSISESRSVNVTVTKTVDDETEVSFG